MQGERGSLSGFWEPEIDCYFNQFPSIWKSIDELKSLQIEMKTAKAQNISSMSTFSQIIELQFQIMETQNKIIASSHSIDHYSREFWSRYENDSAFTDQAPIRREYQSPFLKEVAKKKKRNTLIKMFDIYSVYFLNFSGRK